VKAIEVFLIVILTYLGIYFIGIFATIIIGIGLWLSWSLYTRYKPESKSKTKKGSSQK